MEGCGHSQGTQADTRSWESQGPDSHLEHREGAWPCCDFGLLSSRSVGGYISVLLSHLICGDLTTAKGKKPKVHFLMAEFNFGEFISMIIIPKPLET